MTDEEIKAIQRKRQREAAKARQAKRTPEEREAHNAKQREYQLAYRNRMTEEDKEAERERRRQASLARRMSRPGFISEALVKEAIRQKKKGISCTAVAREFGVNAYTLRAKVKKYLSNNKQQ